MMTSTSRQIWTISRRTAAAFLVLSVLTLNIAIGRGFSDEAFFNDDSEEVSDSTRAKGAKLTFLPFVFYSPETEFAFGVYPNYIFRTSSEKRPSKLALPVYLTTRKQFSLSLLSEIYYAEDRRVVIADLFFNKWPNVFYGLGPHSRADDKEEFTTRNFGGKLELRQKIGMSLYGGMIMDYSSTKFIDLPSSGLLASGSITGVENGNQNGAGISLIWDDRDNILYPGEGNFGAVYAIFYGKNLDGDYAFRSYNADLRKYLKMGNRDILAFQFYSSYMDGNPPFWTMPRLGDIVRGYNPMRFIGKNMLGFQAEYRIHPLWKRWGMVFFAGAGTVENNFSYTRSRHFKSAAGMGIRYLLVESEKLNVRVDFGYGESLELYIDIGEAF